MITIENVLTGQPFSPSFFEARTADSAPLFKLGVKASDALAAVAEGGNIGMFSVGAAKNEGSTLGDASLAIHTLPGQTRTLIIHVDAAHPLIQRSASREENGGLSQISVFCEELWLTIW